MATKSNVREIPDGPDDETGLTPRQRKVLEVIRDPGCADGLSTWRAILEGG